MLGVLPLVVATLLVSAPRVADGARAYSASSPEDAPRSPSVAPRDDTPATAAASVNAFGVDLFKQLGATRPGENIFFSPMSLAMALTMAAEGARGQTEAEMLRVLHVPSSGSPDERAVTRMHRSFASLVEEWKRASGMSTPEIEARVMALRAQLKDAAERTKAAHAKGNWKEADILLQSEVRIVKELNGLLEEIDRFDLRIANALWVDQRYPLSPRFVEIVDRWYGSGAARALDMTGNRELARQTINQWVEEQTANRIRELIPRGMLTEVTRLVITNAVYFQGEWVTPFDGDLTREENFTLASGASRRAKLMKDPWCGDASYAAFTGDGQFFETPREVPLDESERPPTYPDDAGFQVLQLPYKGGALAMVLLLPRSPDGLPALEALLSADRLEQWLAGLVNRTVAVAIPKFELGFEIELSAQVKALGMRRAFTSTEHAEGAEFPGMTSSTDFLDQLYLSAVQHKAWVNVTEKGTEAAAATALMAAPGSRMQRREMVPFTPRFNADHPFVVLIRDTESGAILFLGRVADPTQE
ncbi:MAG: hypothetical protein KF724_13055 [Phycisphaeraceae bacterium]|nr:hypothetical protein [Phycisphaeraceae bacterium]